MPLADDIRASFSDLLVDWDRRKRAMLPAAERLFDAESRAASERLLRALTDDLIAAGRRGRPGLPPLDAVTRVSIETHAREYASARLAAGCTVDELTAEHVTLRAALTQRWINGGRRDVAELSGLHEALDVSLTEAVRWYSGRISDAQDLLNGVLAHDLRSPLSAILNYAEGIARDASLDSHYRNIAERIRVSGLRMGRLVDDVLDFTSTRLKRGLPIAVGVVDLSLLVRDVVDEITASQPHANVRWSVTGDPVLQGDAARIEQMLSNLVSNAVDHGCRGARVTVACHDHGGWLTLTVHNRGEAIPEAVQKVIFFPFIRAAVQPRPSARKSGLGLGLYIARQIVEAHQGTISVASTAQAGTTVTVRLPRQGPR